MVSKLNPRYQLHVHIPSRKHFTEHEIPRLYLHVRDYVVVPALKQARFYACTTEMCISSLCDPYMTFTIDNSWDLRSFCLDTVPLYTDHTGQNIADMLLPKTGVSTLMATTTDSGSNVVAAFRILLIVVLML